MRRKMESRRERKGNMSGEDLRGKKMKKTRKEEKRKHERRKDGGDGEKRGSERKRCK